jgi:hypothetical protein
MNCDEDHCEASSLLFDFSAAVFKTLPRNVEVCNDFYLNYRCHETEGMSIVCDAD